MHNPPRILIVDDNETNRDILLTRLGPHGYDLVQAADGEEAIEVARKKPARPDPARRHDAEDRRHRGDKRLKADAEPAVHADHSGAPPRPTPRTSWPDSTPAPTNI